MYILVLYIMLQGQVVGMSHYAPGGQTKVFPDKVSCEQTLNVEKNNFTEEFRAQLDANGFTAQMECVEQLLQHQKTI